MMKDDAASRAGSAFGEMLNKLGDISARRNARKDVFLEAQRLSSREKGYTEWRDELLAERGLGTIDD